MSTSLASIDIRLSGISLCKPVDALFEQVGLFSGSNAGMTCLGFDLCHVLNSLLEKRGSIR